MGSKGWLTWLLIGALPLALAACSTSMLFPQQPAPPPPGGTQAPAAAAPVPAPDVRQQIRALEDKVRQLERRVTALEQCAGMPKATPATGTPRPPATASPAGEKLYSEGLRLYQAKKYQAARDKFAGYLKAQPRGPRGAEARYYLGESFYQEKKYVEAREEFNKVVVQYPDSILAPTALLRQAYAYRQLNQQASFTETLKRLIQQYPQSPEAQEARRLMK